MLDELLGGGLPWGRPLEVLGDSGAGKTQLLCHLARRLGGGVYLYATEAPPLHTLPDGLRLVHVPSAQQLLRQLRALALETEAPSFVALDAITPLMQPLMGKLPYGHAMLESLHTAMRQLCCSRGVPLALANGTLSASSRAALGQTWASVPSLRCWMDDGTIRVGSRVGKYRVDQRGIHFERVL